MARMGGAVTERRNRRGAVPGGSAPRGHGIAVRVGGAAILALFTMFGIAFALDRLFPPNLDRLATTGTEILDRQGRTLALFPAPGGVWRFRATTDDVAPVLLETLVSTEDRHFWHHPGVNPLSLLRA